MGTNDVETEIQQEFTLGEESALVLRTVSGRVTIRAGDEGRIRVEARKYGRPDAVENTHIDFSQEGDAVHVQTRAESRRTKEGDRICSVAFDVSVPPGCRLEIHTVSADVQIDGLGGPVRVETVSGDVTVNEVSPSCSIKTVSGSFTGASLEGTLHLNSVSGRARVTRARLHEFEVETVSGSVDLETALPAAGAYRVETVSGAVRLRVPDETGITVRLETVSGRVRSELPSTVEKVGSSRWEGRINGGGAELSMHSVSGSVTIAAADTPVPV